jgi:hypothetical protein
MVAKESTRRKILNSFLCLQTMCWGHFRSQTLQTIGISFAHLLKLQSSFPCCLYKPLKNQPNSSHSARRSQRSISLGRGRTSFLLTSPIFWKIHKIFRSQLRSSKLRKKP